MKKDTFYFSHDYNAATDTKVLFLRQQLGMEGYGIYWYLVEQLAQAGGFLPVKIIPVLAMQMQVTEVKVSAVVSKFDLFEMHEDVFFSVRLNKHLEVRKVLIEKGKEGAIKRWGNREAITLPNGGANAKERKGNERKENESKYIIPSASEFLAYAKTEIPIKYELLEYSIKAKYDAWVDNGWKDGNNKPIKNWKSKLKNTIPHLKEFKPTVGIAVKSNAKEIL